MLGAPLLSGAVALAPVAIAPVATPPAAIALTPATIAPAALTPATTAHTPATVAHTATTPPTALTFTPCTSEAASGFSCATLSVPLERGGGVTGNVGLSVERLDPSPTQSAPSKAAVVALAGGPGQAALPLAQGIAKTIAPALTTRDLLVFDQRGTGSSGPLSCSALEGAEMLSSIGQAFEHCAQQIGPQRGAYTTQESVADIEALRQAAGYEKLVLFGVSYGTKVALEYAERYPQNVEALVLDSVVQPERADPFSVGMFQAMKPVFEELCSAGACAGITANPLGDIARLAARLQKHALSGCVYDGSGHRHRATLSNVDLLNLIGAGDSEPRAARTVAGLGAVGAARRSSSAAAPEPALGGIDPQPRPRRPAATAPLASATVPGTPARMASTKRCSWTPPAKSSSCRGSAQQPPKTRLAEALAALHGAAGVGLLPFDASIAWADSVLPGCAQWPNVAPAPPPVGPLPSVPTLILSGAQDLRTPTAGAEAIAARHPGGAARGRALHGSLGARDRLQRVRASGREATSSQARPRRTVRHDHAIPIRAHPDHPAQADGRQTCRRLGGDAGSTLAVVLDTILDLERQVVGATLQADQELPSGSSFGGLRGGYAQITSSALQLHGLSFVDGVQLTGTFPIEVAICSQPTCASKARKPPTEQSASARARTSAARLAAVAST